MPAVAKDYCVLNSGNGAWAFDEFANELAHSLGLEVSREPKEFNYVVHMDDCANLPDNRSFIPLYSVRLATDKRLLAEAFAANQVPTPETHLLQSFDDVRQFVTINCDREWCLKYPTSCGAHGHRMIAASDEEPMNWPRPFIVQQFVKLNEPEVFRIYCAGGEMFGWVARRFPKGAKASPWVAHARGARYVRLTDAPVAALHAAERALKATGLWESFGCVDLLCANDGAWLTLEVGTDGLSSHVDRDIGDAELEMEIKRRVSAAFWKRAGR
jgi:glutathione synthase/RimK-type ligase-like ATP-grasp enzyme